MPVVDIFVGRIDLGDCSGMTYSFKQIKAIQFEVGAEKGFIRPIAKIRVQTPEGYKLQKVKNQSSYGDTGSDQMLFDPVETAKGDSGNVYMRAARVVERMRLGTDGFWQVG